MSSSAPPITESLRTAWAAIEHGDLAGAETACRQALMRDASNLDALSTLGFVLHALQKFDGAETVFEQLTVLQPQDAAHWTNLATSRRCAGHPDAALPAFARAAALGELSANFQFNLGLTHVDRKDFESGRLVLAKAAALEPDDAEIRYYYALCCFERLRNEEALAALQGWESLSGLTEEILDDIGLLLMKLGDTGRAELAIRRSLVSDPANPRSQLSLVQLLERTNRVVEATQALQKLDENPRAQTLGSDRTLVQAQLAQRDGDHERAAGLYEQLLRQCTEPQLTHTLQFPLAKSQQSLGLYDQSFATLTAAHESQALWLKLTAPLVSARGAPSMTITQYSVDPADVARWADPNAPDIDSSPVFIVGFPRSGTTLLELTLDAHPTLKSMDEQPLVQSALEDMISHGVQYPEGLAALTGPQLDAIRHRYWDRARQKVRLGPGQRLVDKNPLNILRLPAIRRLFPNAPLILAVRHPCDVILSCFTQYFVTPDFALLCHDLPTLAVGYRHTFDFWYRQQALLKPRSLEVRYEAFVNDFETQVRTVMEFLHLPWDDAVLAPQKNAQSKGFISTPSYSQVVEPVNKKAVDRWRHYESQFAGILPILRPYLDRWDYVGLGSSNSK